jgi:pyruvate ferredoxin oxidoreductase gamma subunit
VVAAYLLATAAIDEGRFGQAFPAFGAERRGAPVAAFVRISREPILLRCQVRRPEFLIVQDQTLLHSPGVTDGLLPGGHVLVNSEKGSEVLSDELGMDVRTVPASSLAEEYLGRPVPNTALLAAFLALTEILPVAALSLALSNRFQGEVLERNLALVDQAAARMSAGAWRGEGDA